MGLALPGPALALRQTELSERRAGAEELEGALAPTAQAGAEAWEELKYHLSRIEQPGAPPEARVQAVEAILSDGFRGGKIRFAEIPPVIDRLLRAFGSEKEPSVAASLLNVIFYAGFKHRRPEVRKILEERLKAGTDDPVLAAGIGGLVLNFQEADLPEGIGMLPLFQPVLDQPGTLQQEKFITFLSQLVEESLDTLHGERLKRQLRQWGWIPKLKRLYWDDPSTGNLSLAYILWVMGKRVRPEDDAFLQAREKPGSSPMNIPALFKELFRRKEGVPLSREFSAAEIAALADRIAEKGRLPAALLGELSQQGMIRMIFIQMVFGAPAGFQEEGGLLADVARVADGTGRPVQLALPLPKGMEEDFGQFLRTGEVSARLWKGFAKMALTLEPTPEALEKWKKEELASEDSDSWRAVRTLGEKVEWKLYGADWGISGENVFDAEASNLEALHKSNPSALIVVAASSQEVARKDLRKETGGVRRSLFSALADRIGEEKLAAVIEENAFSLKSQRDDERLHNLADLAERVPTSFGIRLEEIPLQGARFNGSFLDELVPEVWDALIFRKEDDGKDPDFFETPQEPRPEALQPAPAPRGKKAVPVFAGAEGKKAKQAAPREGIPLGRVVISGPYYDRSPLWRWLDEVGFFFGFIPHRAVRTFDSTHGVSLIGKIQSLIDRKGGTVRILDLGSGARAGLMRALRKQFGRSVELFAVDKAPPEIQMPKGVHYFQGDTSAVLKQFLAEGETFDAIVSTAAFGFFGRPLGALLDTERLLAPGGWASLHIPFPEMTLAGSPQRMNLFLDWEGLQMRIKRRDSKVIAHIDKKKAGTEEAAAGMEGRMLERAGEILGAEAAFAGQA